MESTATISPETSTEGGELTAEDLKEKGNVCVRNSNYVEAVEYYTQAIKLNSKESALYSNRSLAFLKLKKYYYAYRDADTVIQLKPTWAKGHFRKAEVLSDVGHYDSALLCYGRAMQLQPGDRNLLAAAQKAANFSAQQADYERRLPWVGAGIGIIFGVIIALCDNLLTKTPTLKHPALMVILIMTFAGIGYTISRLIRYYTRLNKKSLLEPPLNPAPGDDYENDNNHYENNEAETTGDPSVVNSNSNLPNRTKYTKAQARLRFKKGKS